jgi:hypothetical protein
MISITARNGTHRFQYCAASSRHGSIALRLLIDWTNRNEVTPQSRTESRQKSGTVKKKPSDNRRLF